MILVRLEFEVRFLSQMVMDDFPGAGWRSGLGYVLRGIWSEERYASLWKGNVPKPWVLDVDNMMRRHYVAGESGRIVLTLIGHEIAAWGTWVQAFHELGQRGLGRDYRQGNGRFIVERILDGNGRTPLTGRHTTEPISLPRAISEEENTRRIVQLLENGAAHRLTLALLRPLSLKQQPDKTRFEFVAFWDALTTRAQNLARLYSVNPLKGDFKALAQLARTISITEAVLQKYEQDRTSRRTSRGQPDKTVYANGALGHVTLEGRGEELVNFLPLLVWGEWLHVGEDCTMGNGKYRIIAG